MKKFALGFAALFLAVFVNFLYEKLSRPTHFTVTPDTKIDPNSELAKYVTQEEIDDFGFRYWDIDEYEENNATLNALRNLLRLKDTDKILNFMTRNGLSADVKMKANTTPLMYASFYDDETTAKRLMEMGADAHAKDNYKLSPLAYAIENNSTKTVKLLLDSGVKFSNKEKIQRYLKAPQNDRIKSLTIDGDNIFVEYEVKYGQKNEGSKGWILPFDYITFGNFTEMLQILFSMGYFDENGNYFKDMEYMPNYEPMLNLLLDNNVSGQPTSEELKEAYKKCYIRHKWAVEDKEKYIYKMNQGRDEEAEEKIKKKYDKYKYAPYSLLYEDGLLQYKPKPPNPEQIKRFDDTINFYSKHCLDENATFKDTKSFVKWANEEKRRENVLRFLEAHKNNPAKVIYIDANISSQDKENLISNKLIQKLRSKDAAER
ncbi:ankyrin repeat domain-containing protein [Campylobacter showae]|uniref:ankyrin repeat domain-containing protein n=1 Tax=Campylobacter showae TaxID=204 RepID=UPI0028D7A878|nr:ankyrin repeat domain-containing protein [Campylobacter showae]